MNRFAAPLGLRHHSLTFPAMSDVPKPLAAPAPPTATVPAPWKLLPGTIRALALGCAAQFQRWTVGSVLPANLAYAAASYQLTPATGCFSIPLGKLPSSHADGPGLPVASRNRSIASVHASVRPLSRNRSVQKSGFS